MREYQACLYLLNVATALEAIDEQATLFDREQDVLTGQSFGQCATLLSFNIALGAQYVCAVRTNLFIGDETTAHCAAVGRWVAE